MTLINWATRKVYDHGWKYSWILWIIASNDRILKTLMIVEFHFLCLKSKSLRIVYFSRMIVNFTQMIVYFITKSNHVKIMKNDPQLRMIIFFFGKNSVLNSHGLDLLHFKMLMTQLMVQLQPTILVNIGLQLVKFKLFISDNLDGLMMVMMKERSPDGRTGTGRISVRT